MRYLSGIFLSLAILSTQASAQDAYDRSRVAGFVFISPGWRSDTGEAIYQAGGGGEIYIYRGLGLAADVGWGSPRVVGQIHRPAGIFTIDGVYSFKIASKPKINPFVVGGSTLIPAWYSRGGYNFGGGIRYWFLSRLGLGVELRDHYITGGNPANHHYFQTRISLVFR
jgi:hypothetical protein